MSGKWRGANDEWQVAKDEQTVASGKGRKDAGTSDTSPPVTAPLPLGSKT